MKIFFIFGWMIFISAEVFSGSVRTIKTDGSNMEPLRLSLGQSTVLRFKDKPQKIIVGNQNYFNIEFVGNDIAIQPLSKAQTNLFVYCDYGRVYGFLLKTNTSSKYDDFVKVLWRPKDKFKTKGRPQARAKKTRTRRIGKRIKISKKIEIEAKSILKNKALGLYLVDIVATNLTKEKIILNDLKVFATRSNKKLSNQYFAIMDNEIRPNMSTHIRIALKLKIKRGFSLNFKKFDETRKIIIYKKHL